MNSYSIRLGDVTARSDLYRLASACVAVVVCADAAPGIAADAAVGYATYEQSRYHDALPVATLNSQSVVVMTTTEAELAALASRSPLGRKLLELRRKVLDTGMTPLDWDGVRAEVQADRNDV